MKISARQYAQTLHDLTTKADRADVPKIIGRFVHEMKKNGHIKIGKQIIDQFEMIYNVHNHITKAKITTAHDIDANQKSQIESYIKRMYSSQKVEATYEKDATITGGVIIRVGSEILDASIRKRMAVLSKNLIHNP